jgi:rubrerythrin
METAEAPTIEKIGILSDIFSQAVTGELIGMSNFASLAETIDDPLEKMEAVEHAESERKHAESFIALARKMNLNVRINMDGVYWSGMRSRFLERAREKDFIGCLIIQEVMLESFAISMYNDVGHALEGAAGKLFLKIRDEEREHLEHSSHLLREELNRDSAGFIEKFETIHYQSMNILSEFSATTDLSGHCGVCHGTCMKNDLHLVNLDIVSMRGNALALYAHALDEIGIPGEKSLVWIANLPA